MNFYCPNKGQCHYNGVEPLTYLQQQIALPLSYNVKLKIFELCVENIGVEPMTS